MNYLFSVFCNVSIVLLIFLIKICLSSHLNLNSECGKDFEERTKRIVGGSNAVKGSWSWQIALNYRNKFQCGGSLITDQWILTAAHCLYKHFNKLHYSISILQLNRIKIDKSSFRNLNVSFIAIHSNYSKSTHLNDIALIKLQKPIDTNSLNITPICVPDNTENYNGKHGYATGYGQYNDKYESYHLKQVKIPILTSRRCKAYYSKVNILTQLCAGAKNKDTCLGDSGGPLAVKSSDNRWHLVGITSYGNGYVKCGAIAGVYTRTGAYKDWIVEILKNN